MTSPSARSVYERFLKTSTKEELEEMGAPSIFTEVCYYNLETRVNNTLVSGTLRISREGEHHLVMNVLCCWWGRYRLELPVPPSCYEPLLDKLIKLSISRQYILAQYFVCVTYSPCAVELAYFFRFLRTLTRTV
jgi:hypothetical protein